MKKTISIICIVALMILLVSGCAGKAADTEVNVLALKGPTAMGMVKLMSDNEEGKTGTNHYSFTVEGAVDAIAPAIAQKSVDIACVPANMASVLYNKTEGTTMVLAVNTLGVLYIVENGNSVTKVDDLKGKKIYASGKGATPEYALNYMLSVNGIDPEKDVTIEYKSEHAECLAALLSDDNAVAMLPEPFVTTAMTQNEGINVVLDMTKEWESAAKSEGIDTTLITGTVIVRKEFAEANPEAVKLFMEQYKESTAYTNEFVEEAASLIEKYDIIKAAVAKKAIPKCNITFIAGDDMKLKLSSYLEKLYEQNPQAVGGALPGEEFYYNYK